MPLRIVLSVRKIHDRNQSFGTFRNKLHPSHTLAGNLQAAGLFIVPVIGFAVGKFNKAYLTFKNVGVHMHLIVGIIHKSPTVSV